MKEKVPPEFPSLIENSIAVGVLEMHFCLPVIQGGQLFWLPILIFYGRIAKKSSQKGEEAREKIPHPEIAVHSIRVKKMHSRLQGAPQKYLTPPLAPAHF